MPIRHRSALPAALWLLVAAVPALADEIMLPHEPQIGPRPFYLVDKMKDGSLEQQLSQCTGPFRKTDFSIGHRGAALEFPEHTKESYVAAARMGAGIIECDVTFTKDRELVCRHSQCDLHTTTNILTVPELAAKCSQAFSPADPATGKKASAKCCTSDITLTEFRRLTAKMDGFNPDAKTPEEYQNGTPRWRTDLYANSGTLMTHDESIALIKSLGAKFTPELKAQGGATLGPPIWTMLTLNDKREIVPSEYAKAAKAAGLDLIGWSLERDGPLHKGGGFYHKSIRSVVDRDGDTLTVLDVLAKQVGVRAMFSDWPATTTFYASCTGMK